MLISDWSSDVCSSDRSKVPIQRFMVRATVIEAARPRKPTEKINGQCNRKTHRAGQGGASLRHSFRGAARHAKRSDERGFPAAQGPIKAVRPTRRRVEDTPDPKPLNRKSCGRGN